ncbi:hypothetical protein, partial [Brucella tritici]|uniref:hypothetical protein n=2 Tax=Brucella tritici TaxID=94626 RepID=UPI001AED6EC2
HQQNSRPANAADLLKSNIAVKLFQPTQGTNLSAASSVAALVVAPYRPHKPKLSTQFRKKEGIFFPQPIWSFLTKFQLGKTGDSNGCDDSMTVTVTIG